MRSGTGASRPIRSIAGSSDAMSSHPPPAVSGRRLKLNYITQVKARPPSFVLFCSRADAIPESYLRYLVHGLREHFDLPGTPIRVTLREKENPFAAQEEDSDERAHRGRRADAPAPAAPPSRSSSSPCCSTCWRSASSSRCCRAWWSTSWAATRAGGGRDARPVRHRLGADAVPVLAGCSARCPTGSAAGR